MLGLDDPKWKALTGGRRTQVDLSPLLRALEGAQEPTESWNELWDAIYHQGDIGDSAFVAVPHLVRIHLLHGVVNWNTYAIVAAIELARGKQGNPDAPEWAKDAYNEALRELAKQGLAELPRSRRPETTRSILGLLAIVFGARTYGRVLLEFTEDELLEWAGSASGGSPGSGAG
jgi:hypothetical protein